MDWITCPSCDEEFRIITDTTLSPLYCPYCAEDLPDDSEDLFNDEED